MRKVWDWQLFLLILSIGSVSLLVIFSLNRPLFQNQLFFWILGLFLLWFFSYFDYRIWQKVSIIFYVFVILLLLFLLFVGDPIRGSVRWFDIGPFRLQPSEMAKASTILLLATFFKNRDGAKIFYLLISLLIVLPIFILVLIQPDIGNSLPLLAIWLAISLASGFKIKDFTILLLLGALLSAILFEILAPYQKERILTFIDPARDPLGTGYHIIQAKLAVGSGQFLGRGLGNSTQSQLKFLPEAESDFIFAATSEQLGFLGGTLLISLYSLLLLKILVLSRENDEYSRLILIGVFAFMATQFLVNVGMNVGILPVTGITLPLVSYGGSSLITTLFLLGIIFATKRFSI